MCPTYGGPLNALISIPAHDPETNQYGPSSYVVYSTAEKVIGIIKLPLDGNPNKAMGLIGHPTSISSIAVSGDGRFVFTAGGTDRCVNIWNVDTGATFTGKLSAIDLDTKQVFQSDEVYKMYPNESGRNANPYRLIKRKK